MSNFSGEQGRTRVRRGVLVVSRESKPAENAARREKGHFGMETNKGGTHARRRHQIGGEEEKHLHG